jgi:hypothetical protein
MATDLIKWKRHQHQHQQSERTAQWSNGIHLSSRYQNGQRSTDDGEPDFYYLKAECRTRETQSPHMDKSAKDVEDQIIEDRFGNVPK